MRAVRRWLILLTIAFTAAGSAAIRPVFAAREAAPVLQSAQLALVSPSACPSSGCATGQRINLSFGFQPTVSVAGEANVKVCVYAPAALKMSTVASSVALTGEVTDKPYTPDSTNCAEDKARPAGYDLLMERVATLDENTPSDAVGFGIRLGGTTRGKGQVLAHLFEKTAPGGAWTPTRQATSPTINLSPPAAIAYVANDAGACSFNGPCYINSGDDGENGIGTGLKDAVDAIPAVLAADSAAKPVLKVIGTYTIKSNTVLINQPLTLESLSKATITYNGSGTCDNIPMVSLTKGITLRNLTINDGFCPDPGRDLVDIDSPDTVLVESNSLIDGNNGIYIHDNTGPITIRFNAVTSNAGHAVFSEWAESNTTSLEVVANNLQGNGNTIDCASTATNAAANHIANHNYWGTTSPGSGSHCIISAGKRLGLAIAPAADGSGVNAQLVKVTGNKTQAFDNQFAYKRSGGTKDFFLFIVDHGYMTSGGPPFTYAAGGESPSPCSNYWDVFLPNGEDGNGTLELYVSYDKTPGCTAVINSTQYCDQSSTASKYPLFWYDPANGLTKWWDNTGGAPQNKTSEKGQTTTCHISENEIQVSIDNTGRPNLETDLNYMPLMVGVPVLKSFDPRASSQTISVTWTTNNEPDITGFYVLRGTDENHLSPISDLIQHTGSAMVGRYYSGITDSGRTNGQEYFYRLQIVRTDGSSIYSNRVKIAANAATITPTITPLPTRTRTPVLPTFTPRPTLRIIQQPTRRPTVTPIPSRTPLTRATSLVLPTLTPTFDLSTPGMASTMTVEARTLEAILGGSMTPPAGSTTPLAVETVSGTGTPVALLDGTLAPQVEGTPASAVAGVAGASAPNPWLSLLLGLLAGALAVGGAGGYWYWRIKQ